MNRVYTYIPTDLTATDLEALEIELTERLTRRRFIIGAGGLLGAAALGACGAGEEAGSDDTEQEATSSGTRTVEHALGSTEITGKPERVICTQNQDDLDVILALGMEPVGVGFYDGFPDGVAPWQEEYAPFEFFESRPQMNLEQIALLEPDLILGQSGNLEEVYDELSEIAPTIARKQGSTDWRYIISLFSRALGEEERSAALIEDMEQKIAAERESISSCLKGVRFSYVGVFPDRFVVFLSSNYPASTLSEFGVEWPEKWAGDDQNRTIQLSLEEFSQLDEDMLILIDFDGGVDELEDVPVFQQLDVVRENRVVRLSSAEHVALSLLTPLNLDYIVERVLPKLTHLWIESVPNQCGRSST